jgi:hypothetical protein
MANAVPKIRATRKAYFGTVAEYLHYEPCVPCPDGAAKIETSKIRTVDYQLLFLPFCFALDGSHPSRKSSASFLRSRREAFQHLYRFTEPFPFLAQIGEHPL